MSNTIDQSVLLSQLRQLAAKSSATAAPAALPASDTQNPTGPVSATGDSFGQAFAAAVKEVNLQQVQARQLADAFERGEAGVDVSQVMIEMQKARISFEALTQVRNKMIAAYQDIMNMPI